MTFLGRFFAGHNTPSPEQISRGAVFRICFRGAHGHTFGVLLTTKQLKN